MSRRLSSDRKGDYTMEAEFYVKKAIDTVGKERIKRVEGYYVQ